MKNEELEIEDGGWKKSPCEFLNMTIMRGTILIIDDEEHLRGALSRILELESCLIRIVSPGSII